MTNKQKKVNNAQRILVVISSDQYNCETSAKLTGVIYLILVSMFHRHSIVIPTSSTKKS